MKTNKKGKKEKSVLTPEKFNKNNFIFTIDLKDEKLTILVQNLEIFPVKTYILTLSLTDLEKMEAFESVQFKNMQKFDNLIRKCIKSDKYAIYFKNIFRNI